MSIIYCEICYEIKADSDFCTLSCHHQFCTACMHLYLGSILQSKEYFKLTCPSESCQNKDLDGVASQLLTPQELEKFNNEKSEYILSIDPLTRWCPKPDCRGYNFYTGHKILSCNTCSTLFCEDCGECYEKGHSCSLFNEFCSYVKKSGARPCPGCRVLVQKQSGCTHMTCRCGTSFCMICGGFLNDNHDWFNCMIGYTHPSYFAILFVVLSFVTFPFQFGFYIWKINAYEKKNDEGNDEWRYFDCCMYLITFVFSPFISVLILVICPWYMMANPGGKNINYYLPRSRWFWPVKLVVYPLVYLFLVLLILLAYVIFNLYLTGRGVVALIKKLVK